MKINLKLVKMGNNNYIIIIWFKLKKNKLLFFLNTKSNYFKKIYLDFSFILKNLFLGSYSIKYILLLMICGEFLVQGGVLNNKISNKI